MIAPHETAKSQRFRFVFCLYVGHGGDEMSGERTVRHAYKSTKLYSL